MDELTVHQIMGEALIAAGKATPEDVAADRAVLEAHLNGVEPPAAPAAPAPAPVAQAAAPASSAAMMGLAGYQPPVAEPDPMFAGPDSPAAYVFDAPFPPGVTPDPESMAIEQSFRDLFHAEGMPVPIAREISRLAALGAANPPTKTQLAMGKQTARLDLERMWGPDYDSNLAIAKAEIARMTKTMPQIPQLLEVTGLGNSVWLAQILVNVARGKGRVR